MSEFKKVGQILILSGKSKPVRSLEIEQVLKLLDAAKKESESDWLLIALAFIYALRASEAVALKPSNVGADRLKVKRLKGSNPVDEPLLEHANPLLNVRQPLFDLCLKTGRNQRLFPMCARTFQRRMHKHGEAAGLPADLCHPHTLKHSILTYLAEKMPLINLQDRSGHVSLGSLGIYLHPKKSATEKLVGEALGSIAV